MGTKVGPSFLRRTRTGTGGVVPPARDRRRLWSLLLLSALVASLSGCGIFDPVENSQQRATAALNQLIRELEADLGNWEQIMRDATDEMRKIEKQVATDLERVTQRAVQATGEEFRCSIDFLGHRVLDEVTRLRDELLNVPHIRRPAFCSTVPDFINLDPDISQPSLAISGYNFNASRPPQVELVDDDGSLTPIPQRMLSVNTHYHLTLDLGATGVQFSQRSDKLRLSWDGELLGEVDVVQPRPRKCRDDMLEHFEPQPITLIPKKTAGSDAEFGGSCGILCSRTEAVQMDMGVTFAQSEANLRAVVRLSATYPAVEVDLPPPWDKIAEDDTVAAGSVEKVIFRPENPGHAIVSVRPSLAEVSHSDTDMDDVEDGPFSPGGDTVVSELRWNGIGPGIDAGVNTRVVVYFVPLEVRMRETPATGCVE